MSIFKKIILLVNLIFLSCYFRTKIYDLDPPIIEFYKQLDDYLLLQYNEPVKELSLILEKEIVVKNNFFTANFYIPFEYFYKYKNRDFKVLAKDSSDNLSESIIKTPIINVNPAAIAIEEIRLRYSKNSNQFIKFKATKAGSLKGFSLFFFVKGNGIRFDFIEENIEKDTFFTLSINKTEDNISDRGLSFNKTEEILLLKDRLSQTSSAIIIFDHKDEIVDYILYYNLKIHDNDYYIKNKNFNLMKKEFLKRGINPIVVDIQGNTIKKTIIKNGTSYIIK